MRWDPIQYGRYADERGRPFLDLIDRVSASSPRRVVDLGCGAGPLTALLADRWPDALIEGVDSSTEMIDAAARLATARLSFRVGDLTEWEPPADADVIVSNAALQWVPDHQPLVRRWADALPRDGWLAFQVPGNFASPSHTLMRELAESPRWAARLGGVLRHQDAVAPPEEYAALLLDAGLQTDVWETTYLHVLTGPDPVLEWVRGTGLRPILAALSQAGSDGSGSGGSGSDGNGWGDDGAAAAFEDEYRAALRAAYPATEHGTLFGFRRIFAVGHRV